MNDAALKSDIQDIVVDEVFPHAPETIWKALTTGALVSRWLMAPTGFEAVVGNRFTYQTTCRRAPGTASSTARCWRSFRTRDCPTHGRAATRTMSDTARDWTRSLPSPCPEWRRARASALSTSGFVLPKNETAFRSMGEGWKKVVRNLGAIADEQD